MDFAGPDALLERIATEKKNVIFLVGSPLTAPAGGSGLGIPGVAGIVERIRSLLKDWPSTLKELDGQIATSPNPYQAAFRILGQRPAVVDGPAPNGEVVLASDVAIVAGGANHSGHTRLSNT